MQTGILVFLAFLTVVFVVAGVLGMRRSRTLTGFFLMNGKLSLGPLVGTLAATNFSLGNMVFLSLIWGYFFGFSGIFWLCVGFSIAALVYMRFIRQPVVRAYLSNRENSGTVHEFLEQSFSGGGNDRWAARIRLAASVATVTCLTLALTLELYLASSLLAPLIGADVTIVFITITVLKCLYSALGGFFAVVVTDMIQGALLIIAIGLLYYFIANLSLPLAPYSSIHAPDLISFLYAPKWTGILSITAVTAGWYLVTMDTWQRACAARSPHTAGTGMLIGTSLLLIGIIALGSFGIYDNLAISHSPVANGAGFSGGYNPITDLYLFKDQMNPTNQFLLGLLGVGFLAAALSTANTFLVVSGHSLVSDLIVGRGRGLMLGQLNERDSKLLTTVARAIIVALSALVILVYFVLRQLDVLGDPLSLFYLAYSVQFALLAPVVAATWRTKPSAKTVFFALMGSLLVSLIWGFGFSMAGKMGIQSAFGLGISDLIYLAPVPPMIVGFLLLVVRR